MLLHCKQPPFTLCSRFLLFCEGSRKGSDTGGCSDLTPVRAWLSSVRNAAFCISSSQKWPSEVTSSSVTLKGVLSSMWDGIYCNIIRLSFRNCWGWRFCAFQSHAMSNYSFGKQVSLNVQSEYLYFKFLKDIIFNVLFSLSFPCGLK